MRASSPTCFLSPLSRAEVDVARGRHDGIEDLQAQGDAAFELGGVNELAIDLQTREPELANKPAEVRHALDTHLVGRDRHNTSLRERRDQRAEICVTAAAELQPALTENVVAAQERSQLAVDKAILPQHFEVHLHQVAQVRECRGTALRNCEAAILELE